MYIYIYMYVCMYVWYLSNALVPALYNLTKQHSKSYITILNALFDLFFNPFHELPYSRKHRIFVFCFTSLGPPTDSSF